MRKRGLLGAILAMGLLSGCDLIRSDYTHPGGSVGYLADKMMPAPTKRLELYRATYAYAYFARVAAVSSRQSDTAVAALRLMLAVRNDLNVLATRLYQEQRCATDLSRACVYYPQMFEDGLPALEAHLYKLAVVGLPVEEAKTVIGELVAGDFLGAIWKLGKVAETMISAAHQGAATRRSEREVYGVLVAKAVGETVPEDVGTARALIDRLAPVENPNAHRQLDAALTSETVGYFDALLASVRTSCRMLRDRLTAEDRQGIAMLQVRSCDDFKLKLIPPPPADAPPEFEAPAPAPRA